MPHTKQYMKLLMITTYPQDDPIESEPSEKVKVVKVLLAFSVSLVRIQGSKV